MEKKNDGGAAYPEIRIKSGDNYNAPTRIYHRGMTLRDYFAGQAITVLIPRKRDSGFVHSPLKSAHMAYEIADAMLKERSK